MERENIWVDFLKSENEKKGIASWSKYNSKGMRMGVADAKGVPTVSCGHVPFQWTLAASSCQVSV